MDSETVPESKVYQQVGEGFDKQVFAAEWAEGILTGEDTRPDGEIAVGHFIDSLNGRQPATIPYDSLLQGLVNIGECGVGKSTVADNILIQMAEDGYGFCHIDMKGEVQDLVRQIPDNRVDDIEIIGSYNGETKQGINILETPPSDEYIDQASEAFADIVGRDTEGVSKAIADGIGKIALHNEMSMEEILNMISTDSENNIEIHKEYYGPLMDNILSLDKDNMEMMPLIRRMQDIIETPVLRRTITNEDGLSLYDAVSNDKIIIVSLDAVADLNIEAKIAHAILRKLINVFEHPQSNGQKFFISIDEADHLKISDNNLDWYFTRARSYKVGVILTIQYLNQMEDSKIVLNNTGNLIAFRHSEVETANKLTSLLNVEGRDTIMNLDGFTALTKLNAKHGIFNKQISTLPQLEPRRETYTN